MYDSFDNTYQATIGIDFLSKTMYLEDRTVRNQFLRKEMISKSVISGSSSTLGHRWTGTFPLTHPILHP